MKNLAKKAALFTFVWGAAAMMASCGSSPESIESSIWKAAKKSDFDKVEQLLEKYVSGGTGAVYEITSALLKEYIAEKDGIRKIEKVRKGSYKEFFPDDYDRYEEGFQKLLDKQACIETRIIFGNGERFTHTAVYEKYDGWKRKKDDMYVSPDKD